MKTARAVVTSVLLLLGAGIAALPAFAAEAPVLDNPDAMSFAVGARLSEVLALSDAQKPAEAATALQDLRADFEGRLNAYETLRVLQVSASINVALQNYADAIADNEALLQMEGVPESVRLAAADVTGQLYLEQGEWTKGIEYLREVDALQGGTNGDTLARIAFAYGQLGQFAEAIPYMEKVLLLAQDAASEDDLNNMAVLYVQAERSAKAIETYERLLELFPATGNREGVMANLAALYIDVGNKVQAMTTLRTLIRTYPMSPRLPTYRQSLDALD
jgi:tetratricopeptide (TPR) repeat protein